MPVIREEALACLVPAIVSPVWNWSNFVIEQARTVNLEIHDLVESYKKNERETVLQAFVAEKAESVQVSLEVRPVCLRAVVTFH
jgi:hypothetical protein